MRFYYWSYPPSSDQFFLSHILCIQCNEIFWLFGFKILPNFSDGNWIIRIFVRSHHHFPIDFHNLVGKFDPNIFCDSFLQKVTVRILLIIPHTADPNQPSPANCFLRSDKQIKCLTSIQKILDDILLYDFGLALPEHLWMTKIDPGLGTFHAPQQLCANSGANKPTKFVIQFTIGGDANDREKMVELYKIK